MAGLLSNLLNDAKDGAPEKPRGIMETIGFGEDDPDRYARMAMLGNVFSAGAPKNFMEGVPQAAALGHQMQRDREQDERDKRDLEEEAGRNQELVNYALSNVPTNLQGIARTQPDLAIKLAQQQNPSIKPMNINDQLVDPSTGQVIGDYRTNDMSTQITGVDAQAMGLDPAKVYNRKADGTISQIGGGGVSVTTNVGEGDKYYETLDKTMAGQDAGAIEQAKISASNNMRLGQLAKHLESAPQGAAGALASFAGNLGIPTEGLDDLQAAEAIISQMVPGQRAPGSGTMSDADLALYKRSLPAIINQPGGNEYIIQTARAINEYNIKLGDIATQIADRTITPAEGRRLQREVPNPLAEFGDVSAPSVSSGSDTVVDWSDL